MTAPRRKPRPCKECGATEHNHFDWMRECKTWNEKIALSMLKEYLRVYARDYVRQQKVDRKAAEKIWKRLIAADEARS